MSNTLAKELTAALINISLLRIKIRQYFNLFSWGFISSSKELKLDHFNEKKVLFSYLLETYCLLIKMNVYL